MSRTFTLDSIHKTYISQISLFTLRKNGEVVQQGDSSLMIYPFNHIISHISSYFSLNIGDLLFTGTPAGVGECVVGDVLEGFIDDERLFELEIK